MDDRIQFETPENILIRYKTAGLGTRFLAWFADQVLLWVLTLGVLILIALAGVSFQGVFDSLDEGRSDDPNSTMSFFLGLMALLWGLGSFVYFGLSELFLRGQTIGKRMARIRVVKADGFALDPMSILIRNIFRVADHLPPLWIIPVLSSRSQRAGDMVGGTVVVTDDPQMLSDVRAKLSSRTAVETEFRFDQAKLNRLRPEDVHAIERILDRWAELTQEQQLVLLDKIVEPLAQRLKMEPPSVVPEDRRLRFLEDLLAAEFRRQSRALG